MHSFKAAGFQALAANHTLQSLNVANAHLTDEDATSLASNNTLNSLNIYGSLCLNKGGIESFLKNTALIALKYIALEGDTSGELEEAFEKQFITNQHRRKQAALASWLQLFMLLAIDRTHTHSQSLFSRLPLEILLEIIGHLDFSVLEKTAAEKAAAEKEVIATTTINLLAICPYEKSAAIRAQLMALFIFEHLSEIKEAIQQHHRPLRFTQSVTIGDINVFLKGTNQKVLPMPAIIPGFKRFIDNSSKEETTESPNKKRRLK